MRKNYSLFFGLVLLAGTICFLVFQAFQPRTTSLKAQEQQYIIEVNSKNEAGEIPVTVIVKEPQDELFTLSYEGIAPLSNEELEKGVSKGFKEKVIISNGSHENEKKIKVKKTAKPKELRLRFLVASNKEQVGKLTLSNESKEELIKKEFVFPREQQEFESAETTGKLEVTTSTNKTNAPTNRVLKETSGVLVKTWPEFVNAWNDPSVRKIKLLDNITRNNTAAVSARTTDIEIDGSKEVPGEGNEKYYKLDLTGIGLMLGKVTSGTSTLDVHDIVVRNNGDNGAPVSNGNSAAIFGDRYYDPNASQVATNKWNLRFGNLIVPNEGRTTGTARLARVPRAKVTLHGDVDVQTRSENFYLGAMYFEDNTNYYGAIRQSNYSTIWFRQPSLEGDTGDNKVVIGKNAVVKLRNVGTGTTYPAIYRYYKEILVGEDSQFIATVPGNAVGLGGIDQRFTAKKGSTVTLTSTRTNSSIATEGPTAAASTIGNAGDTGTARNAVFTIEPGASLFSIGSANASGMIDWSSGSNNKFIIDKPEQYDIRNNNANLAVNVSGTGNSFEIRDSEVSLWKNGTAVNGIPDHSYDAIKDFTINGRRTATTDPAGPGEDKTKENQLVSDFTNGQGNYRRIRGLNTNPTLEMKRITDADKNINTFFRVKLGEIPDDSGLDEDGNMNFIPIYARKDQAMVTINDEREERKLWTDANGYVKYSTDFYQAGLELTLEVQRSGLNSGLQTTKPVLDVTPPEPAVVEGDKVTNGMKQLKGKGAEANAKIYLDINGVREADTVRVDDDGSWVYDLPRYLNIGETVQIFLEDNAGKITEIIEPAAPSTNNEKGNINPSQEVRYRDAVFKPATKYTVVDGLPDKPQMKKEVVSSGGQMTQSGDILTYTLTAENGKEADLDTVWKKVLITDEIPLGLNIDPTSFEVKSNNVLVENPDYTYDPETRFLTVNVGELKSKESAQVIFKAKVEQSAVGKIITNIGKVSGFSPRETGEFIKGPDDPERLHDKYSAEASVENPGGSIFGSLELVSAPKIINFGTATFDPKGMKIIDPLYEGEDLIVKDGRAVQETWTLSAKLEKELANVDNPTIVVPNAIRYVYNNRELTLTFAANPIMSRRNENAEPYNISDTWSPSGDGFKLVVESGESVTKGSYEATIVWELVAGPPPQG